MHAYQLLKKTNPIMGYRFMVTGDFDGDRKIDTLYEHYTDSTFKIEAPKYYDSQDSNFDYSDVIFLNEYLNKQSFIQWKGKDVKIFGGQLGFHYIENCGDVNLDGKDEILVVNQWSDWSNLNHAVIYTFKQKQWKKIFSIPIWEWQFPLTPSVSMIPGLFGNFQFSTTIGDSSDIVLEQELKTFKFMTYYPDHSVEFSARNPIYEQKNEKDDLEYDSLGQQNYIKKYFKKVYFNDSLYLKDSKNPAVFYKASEFDSEEYGHVIMFDFDDPASMITTRIFINHPNSPFKKQIIE
jgi:hypothetical protein